MKQEDLYKRAINNFDKKYYKDSAIELCVRKGWKEERWEEVADLLISLQVEKGQIKALEYLVSSLLISDMDEALS